MAHTFYEGEVVRSTLKRYNDHPFFRIDRLVGDKEVNAFQLGNMNFTPLTRLSVNSLRHTEKDNKGDI